MVLSGRISFLLFFFSAFAISAVLGYPLIVLLFSPFSRRTSPTGAGAGLPTVSLIVVTRNSSTVIEEKVRNCLSLDYPGERLQIIFYSDGSSDDTVEILERYRAKGIQVYGTSHHAGKIPALNDAVLRSTGEVVVLTDTSAMLEADALRKMVPYFDNGGIGGVCGNMYYTKVKTIMEKGQSVYLRFDRSIKSLENRMGSVTSNNGAFYAIRRRLFRPIPPAVTDDLYVLLSVIRQGFRFTFAPEARFVLPPRSKSTSHELERRRRIVSTSLRGIWLSREVLNPVVHGFFSLGLAINKIVRRLLPFFLLLLFVSSTFLSLSIDWMKYLVLLQALCYGAAALFPLYRRHVRNSVLERIASAGHYFFLGNCGTFMGVLDFLGGRAQEKWDPS